MFVVANPKIMAAAHGALQECGWSDGDALANTVLTNKLLAEKVRVQPAKIAYTQTNFRKRNEPKDGFLKKPKISNTTDTAKMEPMPWGCGVAMATIVTA